MAKINKLPQKNKKGLPPTETNQSSNLSKPSSTALKDLNFKVSPEFKKEFKRYALEHDFPSMVELLKTCFQEYKDNH